MTFTFSSRRLTGPNYWTSRYASLAEVLFTTPIDTATWNTTCRKGLKQALEAVQWDSSPIDIQETKYGLTIALYAPLDGLYTGCLILDTVLDAIEYIDPSGHTPLPQLSERTRQTLHDAYQEERNPQLLQMELHAHQHSVPFLSDDTVCSLGLGSHAQTWKTEALPKRKELEALPWSDYKSIRTTLITGTNGKTTTARMLARIVHHAELCSGNTSTDGLYIDQKRIEPGDWTGPGGARAILRDPQVDVAILETARGGMLRRGLSCQWADAAIVTNVSNDHLGEWGIQTIQQMTEVKLLIRRGLHASGRLILCADCPYLVEAARTILREEPTLDIGWFTCKTHSEWIDMQLPGQCMAWLQEGVIQYQASSGALIQSLPLHTLPATMNGKAVHNVANAQAAISGAAAMGLHHDAIQAGLSSFRLSWHDNPGRANPFVLDGCKILVDFGHNPGGIRAIADCVRAIPRTGRLLILLGQSGDHSDSEIQGLAHAALTCSPDHIVIKDMLPYLRGRAPGDIPKLLRDVCTHAGMDASCIHVESSERDAVEWALHWKQPGDILVLFIQADLQGTVEGLLSKGATEGWDSDAFS